MRIKRNFEKDEKSKKELTLRDMNFGTLNLELGSFRTMEGT